jgi:hypothetical protein
MSILHKKIHLQKKQRSVPKFGLGHIVRTRGSGNTGCVAKIFFVRLFCTCYMDMIKKGIYSAFAYVSNILMAFQTWDLIM